MPTIRPRLNALRPLGASATLLLAGVIGGCSGEREASGPPPVPVGVANASAAEISDGPPIVPARPGAISTPAASDGSAAAPAATPEPSIETVAGPASPWTPAILERVAVAGASVTDGFFATLPVRMDGRVQLRPMNLGDAVAAAVPGVEAVSNHGSMFFFQRPDTIGRTLRDAALAEDPTLFVGIDYLFWFGYGLTGHPPGTEADRAARLARMERGLALLDEVTVPIVVGTVPDMTPAIGMMLSAAQVPDASTRDALNAQLAAWAGERERVRLFDLAAVAAGLAEGDRYGVPEGIQLLKPDRLHPTADGLVVLGRSVADVLADLLPDEGTVLDHAAAISRLKDRLVAEGAASAPSS